MYVSISFLALFRPSEPAERVANSRFDSIALDDSEGREALCGASPSESEDSSRFASHSWFVVLHSSHPFPFH